MAADRCGRCGQPIHPHPGAPGLFVDQWNSTHCAHDPRLPHYSAPRHRAVWIVAGCVGGVLVLVAALIVAGVVIRSTSPVARPKPTEASTTASPQPTTDPLAPVPCEPGQSRAFCFPVSGPDYLARIQKALDWRCFEAGEKDLSGYPTKNPACQTRNRSNSRSATIGHQRRLGKNGPQMDEIRISASVRALNGKVTPQQASAFGTEVFGKAVTHLWPDDKALQREARDTLARLRKGCQKPDLDLHTAKISKGYEVSCTDLTAISIRHDNGQVVTTISDILSIRVPFDHGWN